MTDPFIARVDAVLDECDATQLPPLATAIDEVPSLPDLAARIRVPRAMVEATPIDPMAQARAECEAQAENATSWPPPPWHQTDNGYFVYASVTKPAGGPLAAPVTEHEPPARRRRFRWPWTRT